MAISNTRKLLLLPGDGIGPEVVREVKKIIEWLNKNKSLDFKIEEELIGRCIDRCSQNSYYR